MLHYNPSDMSTTTPCVVCALNNIWGNDKFEKYIDESSEQQMRCLQCNTSFGSIMCHLLNWPKLELGECTGI